MARDDTAREPGPTMALLDRRSSRRSAATAVATSTGTTRKTVPAPAGGPYLPNALPVEVRNGF